MNASNPNIALLKRHPKTLIVFLALLAATPPLTTDMYLPSIPRIAEHWGASISTINLSLVLWFVAFSAGLIMSGIFSDRIGRKPIALYGTLGFMVASALCGAAQSPIQLILFRILQGFFAAAPSAMCLAISRDCYEGRERQKALAWIGIILLLAPMLAPFVGALLLKIASWRFIFMTQAFLGLLISSGVWFYYRETITEKEEGRIASIFQAYGRLAHNRNYVIAVLTMSLAIAPGFAFVGFSTIVYLHIYHVNDTLFALLFASNALSLMLGSVLCTKLLGFYPDDRLIAAALIGGTTAGTLLLLLGGTGYGVFAGLMALYSFSFGMTRPLANNLILEQVSRDIGTASSMIIFVQFVCGAITMAIATAPWKYPLLAFGLLVSVVPACVLFTWTRVKGRFYSRSGLRTKQPAAAGGAQAVVCEETPAPAVDDNR